MPDLKTILAAKSPLTLAGVPNGFLPVLLADLAISGASVAPFDVDGDAIGDVGYSDLTNALDVLNNNFHEGKSSGGALETSVSP